MKTLQDESVAPKTSPGSFLKLPPELRQDILIRTYHATSISAFERWNDRLDNGRSWLIAFHKAKINDWANTLQSIDKDIAGDVEYVKAMWLKEVNSLPPCDPNGTVTWWDLSEPDRHLIWSFTQNGSEQPWKRIHRRLYILNRNWYHDQVGQDKFALLQGWKWSAYPKWDKQGGAPNKSGDYNAKRWNQGSSKIVWKDTSKDHHPSTWKQLQDAVNGDLA
ncbi:hypothetical protein FKW77_009530 [Venturia effusa]|uniref:Uncharacterized protein n=1 Tax=Venturia effusa TaxID=50376 RepID=A0A517LEL7_9PEZI|nr:hypothetical protein FKW77_009530 [Venturia effusa]